MSRTTFENNDVAAAREAIRRAGLSIVPSGRDPNEGSERVLFEELKKALMFLDRGEPEMIPATKVRDTKVFVAGGLSSISAALRNQSDKVEDNPLLEAFADRLDQFVNMLYPEHVE